MKETTMKRKALKSTKGTRKDKPRKGYQVWHFALAVPALAITLQVMLGSLTPLPQEHNPYSPSRSVTHFENDYNHYRDHYYDRYQRVPEVEVYPLHLQGDTTGPLLASVIKDYFPQASAAEAIDLRDTLPPCDNPRMIVILNKDEDNKPVF